MIQLSTAQKTIALCLEDNLAVLIFSEDNFTSEDNSTTVSTFPFVLLCIEDLLSTTLNQKDYINFNRF